MASKKSTNPKRTTNNKNPSIRVKIDRLNDYEGSSIKAFASANIGGAFAVHGLKVIDSEKKGLFIAMPANSYPDADGNTKYSEIFHAITADARAELNEKVLDAYHQVLEKQQSEDEDESEELLPQM